MYYIDKNKEIFGFESDGSQDHLITVDMVEISLEEIQAISDVKQNEIKESTEYKIQEAKAYLASTDWYIIRRADTGIDVPEDVLVKREEARGVISDFNK